eukprot:6255606-Prymnesium_polylepis.2
MGSRALHAMGAWWAGNPWECEARSRAGRGPGRMRWRRRQMHCTGGARRCAPAPTVHWWSLHRPHLPSPSSLRHMPASLLPGRVGY